MVGKMSLCILLMATCFAVLADGGEAAENQPAPVTETELIEFAQGKARRKVIEAYIYEQCEMGVLLLEGDVDRGVEKNALQAVQHLTQAALGGDDEAQFRLAILYDNEGVEYGILPNYPLAIELFTKAANQGCEQSAANLVGIYTDGRNGIAANRALAKYWREKAVELGYDTAADDMHIMNNSDSESSSEESSSESEDNSEPPAKRRAVSPADDDEEQQVPSL